MAIPGSPNTSRNSEPIDEIEIQKGILQIAKGLSFLHTSARLVHSNINPDSIVINTSGDWKISGLGLTIPLLQQDGSPTRWESPSYDVRIPPSTQRSFDYIAPDYALNEQIVTASDLYSLGCILFAVHAKGNPPFKNHNSLSSLRSNVGRLQGGGGISGTTGWDSDLINLIHSLITPTPLTRLTSETISTHAFFSSIAVSTLQFLDPSTFAPKPREEKIAFMKGLQTVLPRFSEGMRRRKVLPSILAEMKDPLLLPSILPNVFNIATTLDASQFQQLVLPSLKPLFVMRDPPQNMIILLENLGELQKKTTKNVFRQDVLPLVYNALESEHAAVQERALEAVPGLCETIDYAELQSVLFPRVALVFTKTRILSVKVSTLKCFHAMVKTLDQVSLTQKLVPLLAKIRTKEPAVMVATLAVHEEMGKKIDRESIALHLLPQLWQMSVGPLLNVEQFGRFMTVIRGLGERVEREHAQHLRDAQRIEDRSAMATTANGTPTPFTYNAPSDFEALVGGRSAGAAPVNGAAGAATMTSPSSNGNSFEDDIWGSILNSNQSPSQTPSIIPTTPQAFSSPPLANTTSGIPGASTSPSLRPKGTSIGARTLGARQLTSPPSRTNTLGGVTSPASSTTSTSSSYFPSPPSKPTAPPTLSSYTSTSAASVGIPNQPKTFFTPLQPQSPPKSNLSLPSSFPALTPQTSNSFTNTAQPANRPTGPAKPNYNISLAPSAPSAFRPSSPSAFPPLSTQQQPPSYSSPFSQQPLQPTSSTTAFGSSPPLQPTAPSAPAFFSSTPLQPQRVGSGFNASSTNGAKQDLSGFDPLL